MKLYSILTILLLLVFSGVAHSQYVYKIKADSLLVTNDSCNAEFNLENRSRDTLGFLYNKGKGRTEFRRAVSKYKDSMYVIGNDTLTLPVTYFQNGLSSFGKRSVVAEFGSDTTNYYGLSGIFRPTVLNQGGNIFQWMTGYSQQFHVTNNPYLPFNQTMGTRSVGTTGLDYYTPLRVSHDLQGFIYLENNFKVTGFNGPNFGIMFGNRDTSATKFSSWGGQMVQGGIVLESLGNGVGGSKDIPTFAFTVAGDTISGRAAAVVGTGFSKYGAHRLPTLAAGYRFSIGGGSLPYGGDALNYPYTRFYADAASQPFVWKNLPFNTQSTTIDTVLSIDYVGNVKQRQLPQILTATATLDFANTNAGNSTDLTITVTGAADGDVVSLGVPNAATSAKSCYTAWVSAANTVTVRFNNYSSAAINPASGTFKVKVSK